MIKIYLHKSNIAIPQVLSKTFSFNTRYYGVKLANISLSSKGVYKLTVDGVEFSNLELSAKRSPSYKSTLLELSKGMAKEIEKYNFSFIHFYKWTPTPKSRKIVEEKLSKIKPNSYTRITFNIPEPRKTDVFDDLQEETKALYYSIWSSNKSKKEKYIKEHLEEETKRRLDLWNELKDYHETIQDTLEYNANKRFQKEFEAKCKVFMDELTGPSDLVNKRISDMPNLWKLPFEVILDCDYNQEDGIIDCVANLPEIITIPTNMVQYFSNGRIGIIDKTKKESERDSTTCLLGLSFYIAGLLFNTSVNVNKIRLAVINDQFGYYWVEFDRDDFSTINFETSLDPLTDIMKLPIVVNLKSTSIIPIEKDAFYKQVDAAIQASKLLKANPNLTTMLLKDADVIAKHFNNTDLKDAISNARKKSMATVIVDKKFLPILHELQTNDMTKKKEETRNSMPNESPKVPSINMKKRHYYAGNYMPLVKIAAYDVIKHYKYSAEMLMNDLSIDDTTANQIILELNKKGILGNIDQDGYYKVLIDSEDRLDFIFSWT